MRLRGPAEAASQAALTGLACCFQERCQVRLRCPARWSTPHPHGQTVAAGGGAGEVTAQIYANTCPQI